MQLFEKLLFINVIFSYIFNAWAKNVIIGIIRLQFLNFQDPSV